MRIVKVQLWREPTKGTWAYVLQAPNAVGGVSDVFAAIGFARITDAAADAEKQAERLERELNFPEERVPEKLTKVTVV